VDDGVDSKPIQQFKELWKYGVLFLLLSLRLGLTTRSSLIGVGYLFIGYIALLRFQNDIFLFGDRLTAL